MISLRSKLTQSVLSYFFLHEKASLYVNEMARLLQLDSGNLTRKLIELELEGILKSNMRGNQKNYSLNSSYRFFHEYKEIIKKSFGLEPTLKKSLKNIAGIQEAYIFGSYAEDQLDLQSDIDLLVIGDHKTLPLHKEIAIIQKKANREINLVNLTPTEFEKKKRKDPFIKSVMKTKTIKLI